MELFLTSKFRLLCFGFQNNRGVLKFRADKPWVIHLNVGILRFETFTQSVVIDLSSGGAVTSCFYKQNFFINVNKYKI